MLILYSYMKVYKQKKYVLHYQTLGNRIGKNVNSVSIIHKNSRFYNTSKLDYNFKLNVNEVF